MKTGRLLLPIFSSRDGRIAIGSASSVAQAQRVIRSLIDIPKGFVLSVGERSSLMQEILSLPRGYVYCVSHKWK